MKKTAKYAAALLFFTCLGYSQRGSGDKEPGDIAIVVNSANPTENLSVAEVRRILLGERMFWAGNVQIKLVLRERGARERDQVIVRLLKMNNAAFDAHWRAKVFRGEAAGEPLVAPSSAIAHQYVKQLPGAIAFVSMKNKSPELKVLKLDGKMPGEPGYALQ